MQWSCRHPSSLPYPRASAWSETHQLCCVEHAPGRIAALVRASGVHEHTRIGRHELVGHGDQAEACQVGGDQAMRLLTVTNSNRLVGRLNAANFLGGETTPWSPLRNHPSRGYTAACRMVAGHHPLPPISRRPVRSAVSARATATISSAPRSGACGRGWRRAKCGSHWVAEARRRTHPTR